jgi:hypothetical protein
MEDTLDQGAQPQEQWKILLLSSRRTNMRNNGGYFKPGVTASGTVEDTSNQETSLRNN